MRARRARPAGTNPRPLTAVTTAVLLLMLPMPALATDESPSAAMQRVELSGIGVAATFSAQAIARTREFGMLRHVGVTRGQVLRVLALEGALATGHALLVGLATGLLVSLVLVRVVNRQSFHWTMDFSVPVVLIGTLCIVLLLCATATAALAGRRATGLSPLRAVHEDW